MSLEFIGISHAFGKQEALTDVSLEARGGDITCLLGPSGCGKTTLLKLAAGLVRVQAGEIRLDGEALATPRLHPPPEARSFGLVFQEGALFPHLTVAQNIGFGIRKRPDWRAVVQLLLEQIGLPDMAERYPHTLSGGQQQRVALARALAPEPRVLLLDEPFAAVDVVRRRTLREETRQILKARKACVVFVTHDPEEAQDVADRIVVMDTARVVQSGSPHEIYSRPQTAAVGCLFGDGQVLQALRSGEHIDTGFGPWPLTAVAGPLPEASRLDLLVRPDALVLDCAGEGATVEDVRSAGSHWRVLVASPRGDRLWLRSEGGEAGAPPAQPGQPVSIAPRPGALFAFAAGPSR